MMLDLATRERVMLFLEMRRGNAGQARIPKGFEGGGRFRGLKTQLVALLKDWAKGEGSDDPIGEHLKDLDPKTRRAKLLTAITDMRKERLAAGDSEGAARLVPRRGAPEDELKTLLYQDAKAGVRGKRDADRPSAKFTLQGKAHHDKDVAVYRTPDGKPVLYREDDSGHRGAKLGEFADLAALEKWADDNGEPRLAEWARKEQGGQAPKKPQISEAGGIGDETVTTRLPPTISSQKATPLGERVAKQLKAGTITPGEAAALLAGGPAPAKKATPRKATPKAPKRVPHKASAFPDRGELASARTGQAALDAATNVDDVPSALRGAGLPEADVLSAELALRRYQGSRFANLNEQLYGLPQGDVGSMQARETLAGLTPVFEHMRLGDDVVVYRGSKTGLSRDLGDDSGDLTGREWVSPAFQSTSANPDIAEGFAQSPREGGRPTVVRIHAPKGTPAVSLSRKFDSGDPENVSEAEVVLGRGLRYRVTKDHGVDANGVRHLDVEVVPSSPLADAPDLSNLTTRQKRARFKALGFTPAQVDELAPTAAAQRFSPRRAAEAASEAAAGPPGPARLEAIKATLAGLNETQLRAVAREAGIKIPPKGSTVGGQLGTDAEDGLRVFVARNLDSFAITGHQIPTAVTAKKATSKGPRPSGLPTDRKPESGDFDDLADRIFRMPEAQKLEIFQDLNATELARLARKFGGDAMMVPGWLKTSDRRQGLKLPDGLTLDEKRRWLAKELTPAGAKPTTPRRIKEDVPLIGDPEGDNSIMHGDSATMELAQAYARKNRNGTANRLMELRRSISTQRGEDSKDLDGPQKLVDELKRLRDAETDADLQKKLDRAIKEIDFPKRPVFGLPEGTPPAVRKLIDDLNRIPVARAPKGSRLHMMTTREDSPVDRIVQLLKTIEDDKGNVSLGEAEREIEGILHTYHESVDGAYRMWGLWNRTDSDRTFSSELREWIKGLRQATRSEDLDDLEFRDDEDELDDEEDDESDEEDLDDEEEPSISLDELLAENADVLAAYPEPVLAPATRARALAMLETRAAGHDVTPGHDELHHYWTRGEGLAKWAESPKPWTTLVAHLTKYVGPERAKVYASRWFIEVFGFAAGSDLNRVTHGKPPRGHLVGPG